MKKLLVVKQQCPDDPHARTAENVELIQIKNIPAIVPTVLPVSFNSQSQTVFLSSVSNRVFPIVGFPVTLILLILRSSRDTFNSSRDWSSIFSSGISILNFSTTKSPHIKNSNYDQRDDPDNILWIFYASRIILIIHDRSKLSKIMQNIKKWPNFGQIHEGEIRENWGTCNMEVYSCYSILN